MSHVPGGRNAPFSAPAHHRIDEGRIVILGEAGMLRAQRESSGSLVGMNVPGYDNRQLALNIMHWLSRWI